MTFLLAADRGVDQPGDIVLMFAGAVFTALGSLILARTDGNRVGWVVSATGLALLASGVAAYLAERGESDRRFRGWSSMAVILLPRRPPRILVSYGSAVVPAVAVGGLDGVHRRGPGAHLRRERSDLCRDA